MNTETQTTRDVPNAELVQEALDDLAAELDLGFIIGGKGDRWECGQCGGKGADQDCIKHKEGCIQPSWDRLVKTLRSIFSPSQTPTDTTRKPESGASGCGGAEESRTHLEFSYPNGEYNNEYGVDATADGIELMDGLNLITWEWIERAYATLKKGNLDRQ